MLAKRQAGALHKGFAPLGREELGVREGGRGRHLKVQDKWQGRNKR